MIFLLSALIIMLSPHTLLAQSGTSGYIQVTLEYTSMFPGKLQVVDMTCKQPRSVECAKANITLQREACQQQPVPVECNEARTLLDTSFCIEGLVHDGRISQGEKIIVRLCKSASGYGNLSMRNAEKGERWTNHLLLNDGQIITYP